MRLLGFNANGVDFRSLDGDLTVVKRIYKIREGKNKLPMQAIAHWWNEEGYFSRDGGCFHAFIAYYLLKAPEINNTCVKLHSYNCRFLNS